MASPSLYTADLPPQQQKKPPRLGLQLLLILVSLALVAIILWPWWFPIGWSTQLPIGRWLWTLGISAELFFGTAFVSRIYWRVFRKYTTVWDEIIFFQTDSVTPTDYTAIIDQIYESIQVRSRIWNTSPLYRLFVGQNTWAINLWRDPQNDNPQAIHIVLSAPRQVMSSIESALHTHYTNLRYKRLPQPPAIRWPYLIRWQMRYQSALHLLKMPTTNESIPMEIIAQQLAAASYPGAPPPFHFQLLMMPVPTQRARKTIIDKLNIANWEEFATEKHAADKARTQIGNGRFRTEWRAGALDYNVLMRLAGAWQSGNSHAELKTHNVLIWRDFMRRWITFSLPRLWPFASGPTLWAGELTTLIVLPTGYIRVPDIVRSMTRRMPAALAIARDHTKVNEALKAPVGIVQAEPSIPDLPPELVGLWEEDRHKNILLLGIQGSGKSTNLINIFRTDALATDVHGFPKKAVILIDIGKDTGWDALRCTPPDREVIWFRPSDPQNKWMIQPLSSVAADATQVDQVLQMLVDVFGEDSIRARSKMILGNAIRAIIDVEGAQASFQSLHRMITNSDYRDMIVEQIKNDQTREFWQGEFAEGLANNPSFWEEALAAPRNKLDALLRNDFVKGALDAATASKYMRHAIDWDRVIRDRQVVILNINKDELGAEATRLFGIAALMNLWYAIQRQQKLKYEDRASISILIDEAQNFLSPSFTSMLTEGRAYGLQAAIAVRFLTEIKDQVVQAAIVNLCQNRIIHRISLVDEAKTLMQLGQQLYTNNITLNEDVQSITNFAADDYMHLADRTAICMWQARGVLQPPFFARTIDWRPYAHDEWSTYHLAHQKDFYEDPADKPITNEIDEEEDWDESDNGTLTSSTGYAAPPSEASVPQEPTISHESPQQPPVSAYAAFQTSKETNAKATTPTDTADKKPTEHVTGFRMVTPTPSPSKIPETPLEDHPPGFHIATRNESAPAEIEPIKPVLKSEDTAPTISLSPSVEPEHPSPEPQELSNTAPTNAPPDSVTVSPDSSKQLSSDRDRLKTLADLVHGTPGPLRSWLQRNPQATLTWLENIVPQIIDQYSARGQDIGFTNLMMEVKRRYRAIAYQAPSPESPSTTTTTSESALTSHTTPDFLK